MTTRYSRRCAALILAALLPLSACATTEFEGTYMPLARDVTKEASRQTLAKGSQWLWLWGLFDSGTFEFNEELKHGLRPEEGISHLVVKDRLSIGGFFLWLITAGIVSHHTLVASGTVTSTSHVTPSAPPPNAPPQ